MYLSRGREIKGGFGLTQLTVGDLFCGAGGFSEGFRQAGFKISWAFDNWKPAYETYNNNFPGTEVITEDVRGFDFQKQAKRLKPIDVLIGSPPCQHFSLANRGGNGDVKRGLEFVAKFLEAVKALEPKYWIMENVPNLKPKLEEACILDLDRFKGEDIQRYFPARSMIIVDSSSFGVPQKRKRLFSGSFPLPQQTTETPINMRRIVIDGLPYPVLLESEKRKGFVTDPLYGIEIPSANLRDHFMDTTMSQHQIKMSRREKQHHRWAGKMKFPDDLDSPSRTICATSVSSGRQAIVIKDTRKSDLFRTPTIRECASLQGFPITYQFSGSTLSERQTLVGNAVPPPVARSFALAILRQEGLAYSGRPKLFPAQTLVAEVKNGHDRRHTFPLLRSYRCQVPGTYASCRVDLDNHGDSPTKYPCGDSRHIREWRAVLYLGYARDYIAFKLDLATAVKLANKVLESSGTHDSHMTDSTLKRVIQTTVKELAGQAPDASSLQAIWAGRLSLPHGPDWILDKVGEICHSVAGKPKPGTGVSAKVFSVHLKGKAPVSQGKDSGESEKWREEPVSSYAACVAVSLTTAAIIVNEGTEWLEANWERRYNDSSLGVSGPFPAHLAGSKDSDLAAFKGAF
jgi:DNA-cytosine methyltransferase